MSSPFRGGFVVLVASAAFLAAGSNRPAEAGPFAGPLYEAFGPNGVSALDLLTGLGIGNLFVPATNIVAGGGMVYFETGDTILSTSADLVGLNTVTTTSQPATGLALDPTDGILYETLGADGVAAISLSTGRGVGNLGVTATNIVAGGGMVYFESGDTIYSTSADLVGLNTVITSSQPATGLALDATDGILYESFGTNGVAAISLLTGRGLGNLGVTATNIVFGGGMVYLESGDTIYSSSANLVGLNTVITNGDQAAGLAVQPAPAVAPVPEPASLGLLLAGLLGLAGRCVWISDRPRA